MTFSLRPYQSAAIDALWAALRRGVASPLACLPTGAGKSPVVAELCRQAVQQWGGRVLVLVHVRELVSQLAEAVRRTWPDAFCPLGILSAGLGQRSIDRITVAGIQSAFRRAVEIGRIDLIIVDEAHLIPPDGDGMYRTLLTDLRVINPKLRIVGLTATPYRLGHGLIAGEGNIFTELVHDVPVVELIDGGFLSPLRGKDGGAPDLGEVHKRGGEFIASELEAVMSDDEKVRHAVDELMRHGGDRMAWLVFCTGVSHAAKVAAAINAAGVEAAVVTGETPTAERDDAIARYKAGALRCLVNVNVLTTGFDAPHVDLVALLRPTESPGLYYQMVGRGFRRAPGKADCLILDLAGNIARHGPIETLNERIKTPGHGDAPTKTCEPDPEANVAGCQEINHAGAPRCVGCGREFRRHCPWEDCRHRNLWSHDHCEKCGRTTSIEARHAIKAAVGDPVREAPKQLAPPVWHDVSDYNWMPWTKKGAEEGAPRTLCVEYFDGLGRTIGKEWVCLEHTGYAQRKAIVWLERRLLPGLMIAEREGCLVVITPDGDRLINADLDLTDLVRWPSRIAMQEDPTNPRWTRIVDYDFTEQTKEAMTYVGSTIGGADDDEPPF